MSSNRWHVAPPIGQFPLLPMTLQEMERHLDRGTITEYQRVRHVDEEDFRVTVAQVLRDRGTGVSAPIIKKHAAVGTPAPFRNTSAPVTSPPTVSSSANAGALSALLEFSIVPLPGCKRQFPCPIAGISRHLIEGNVRGDQLVCVHGDSSPLGTVSELVDQWKRGMLNEAQLRDKHLKQAPPAPVPNQSEKCSSRGSTAGTAANPVTPVSIAPPRAAKTSNLWDKEGVWEPIEQRYWTVDRIAPNGKRLLPMNLPEIARDIMSGFVKPEWTVRPIWDHDRKHVTTVDKLLRAWKDDILTGNTGPPETTQVEDEDEDEDEEVDSEQAAGGKTTRTGGSFSSPSPSVSRPHSSGLFRSPSSSSAGGSGCVVSADGSDWDATWNSSAHSMPSTAKPSGNTGMGSPTRRKWDNDFTNSSPSSSGGFGWTSPASSSARGYSSHQSSARGYCGDSSRSGSYHTPSAAAGATNTSRATSHCSAPRGAGLSVSSDRNRTSGASSAQHYNDSEPREAIHAQLDPLEVSVDAPRRRYDDSSQVEASGNVQLLNEVPNGKFIEVNWTIQQQIDNGVPADKIVGLEVEDLHLNPAAPGYNETYAQYKHTDEEALFVYVAKCLGHSYDGRRAFLACLFFLVEHLKT